VQPGLDEKIMSSLLGPAVPPNPKTGGPGLRPYSLVVTNAGGLDDMEYDDSSWLWSFGTFVCSFSASSLCGWRRFYSTGPDFFTGNSGCSCGD
jgi:hypothetical protein